MSPDPQRQNEIKQRMEALIARNPAYQGLCGLVGDLLLAAPAGPGELEPPSLQRVSPEEWSQGRPLWILETWRMDWNAAWERLLRLAQSLQESTEQEGVREALDRARTDGQEAERLFRMALAGEFEDLGQAAEEMEVAPPVLKLLLRVTLRPWLLAAARQDLQHLDLAAWTKGRCPLCGSPPALAHLAGEGGQRSLHCSLCETSWAYPRLSCPFCSSQDPKGFSLLKGREEEGLQVELCGSCGQYLKTLDLRSAQGPVIVPLDDVATWHLDLMAQEHLAH